MTKYIIIMVVFLLSSNVSLKCQEISFSNKLKGKPDNTLIEILKFENSGQRYSPALLYVPHMKKMILTGGVAGGRWGQVKSRHYDTEEFNLLSAQWLNAYPKGFQKERPVTGPIEGFENDSGKGVFRVENSMPRIASWYRAYLDDSRSHNQWCYVPKTKTIYMYLRTKTIAYNVDTKKWRDCGANICSKGKRFWGSLCYDQLNDEILSFGGCSEEPGGNPGSWTYRSKANKWARLKVGSENMNVHYLRASTLQTEFHNLLSATRSRFFVTESAEESKKDLGLWAESLRSNIKKLSLGIDKNSFDEFDKAAAKKSVQSLDSSVVSLAQLVKKINSNISAAILQDLNSSYLKMEISVNNLSPEPRGRGQSQMAYDPIHMKIILFGGNGQDRVLSDTWVYDCKTRRWEQCFPALSPSPRGGHVLLYLPKSGKILLAGGFGMNKKGKYATIPFELWIYDINTNDWQNLLHIPLTKKGYSFISKGSPRGSQNEPWIGAVDDNDNLMMFSNKGKGSVTWGCKVNPAKILSDNTNKFGVKSNTTVFSTGPLVWEKVANINREKVTAFYNKMPVNQWLAIKFPKYAPGSTNRWGKTAYDFDRQQLLFWGGGHATSRFNDVAHFSMRTWNWTVSYNFMQPLEPCVDHRVQSKLTFMGRPNVPLHAWRSYDYDPSGKMVYLNYIYDVHKREWLKNSVGGKLEKPNGMRTIIEYTPHGAVAVHKNKQYLFKNNQWSILSRKGPSLKADFGDGHGICYDSKRDCLWVSSDKLIRYDFKTKSSIEVKVDVPEVLMRSKKPYPLYSEQVYLPQADLILLMRLFKNPDGKKSNIVWDPKSKKYYWANIPFIIDGKRLDDSKNAHSWHNAISYDPKLSLSILNDSAHRRVWVLRLDRSKLNLTEVK